MTLNELKEKFNKVKEQESYSESVKVCRILLEDCVDYIYEKTNTTKPKNASLLELVAKHERRNPRPPHVRELLHKVNLAPMEVFSLDDGVHHVLAYPAALAIRRR